MRRRLAADRAPADDPAADRCLPRPDDPATERLWAATPATRSLSMTVLAVVMLQWRIHSVNTATPQHRRNEQWEWGIEPRGAGSVDPVDDRASPPGMVDGDVQA